MSVFAGGTTEDGRGGTAGLQVLAKLGILTYSG
jgi:hypothetical protein